ncbi:MAG: RNA polymerase ECF-type sigma factor, partial [uncultured Solirubrobacteraceae bacterium]
AFLPPTLSVNALVARRRGAHGSSGPRRRQGLQPDLRPPLDRRLLARVPHVRTQGNGRRRRAGGVPEPLARRSPVRLAARLGPHVDPRDRAQPRDRRAAPLDGARQAPRQRRGHRGALRGPRARRGRGRPPRRQRRDAPGARDPSPGSAPGHRARLLRRVHPHGDRRDARHTAGHRQGPDASRPGEAARDARRGSPGGMGM